MPGFAKQLYWDLCSPSFRFQYGLALIRNFPGEAGVKLRAWYLAKYLGKVGSPFRVRAGVKIVGPEHLEIGDASNLGEDCHIQASGGLTIGSDVMMGPGVKIWTLNHKFDDTTKPILEQGWNARKVVISDGCWLGANVFILPGAILGEGCVIGAGSVVEAKAYPAWSIIAGNPGRIVGNRKNKTDRLFEKATARAC